MVETLGLWFCGLAIELDLYIHVLQWSNIVELLDQQNLFQTGRGKEEAHEHEHRLTYINVNLIRIIISLSLFAGSYPNFVCVAEIGKFGF